MAPNVMMIHNLLSNMVIPLYCVVLYLSILLLVVYIVVARSSLLYNYLRLENVFFKIIVVKRISCNDMQSNVLCVFICFIYNLEV